MENDVYSSTARSLLANTPSGLVGIVAVFIPFVSCLGLVLLDCAHWKDFETHLKVGSLNRKDVFNDDL